MNNVDNPDTMCDRIVPTVQWPHLAHGDFNVWSDGKDGRKIKVNMYVIWNVWNTVVHVPHSQEPCFFCLACEILSKTHMYILGI